MSTFQACLTDLADDISTSYRGFVCDCATNAWITDRLRPSKLDQDLARCAVAGRYREDTGQNPTLRQFAAIRVAPSRVRSGSGAPVSQPVPGASFRIRAMVEPHPVQRRHVFSFERPRDVLSSRRRQRWPPPASLARDAQQPDGWWGPRGVDDTQVASRN